MTAINFDSSWETTPKNTVRRRPRFLRILAVMFRRRRHSTRRYLELSRLDERLLYDIGIDPLDVRNALLNRPGPSILMEPMRQQFKFNDNVHPDLRNG